MDTSISVPEEYKPDSACNSNSYIPKIDFCNIDLATHTEEFLPVFWSAWNEIVGEDKSKAVKIQIKGVEHEVLEIEALLYWYMLDQGCQIQLALVNYEIVGFIIYQQLYEAKVLSVRMFYLLPSFRKMKIGNKLIDSTGAQALIFQTQKNIPPEIMFDRIKNRPVKLIENEKLITWTMVWENKNGC